MMDNFDKWLAEREKEDSPFCGGNVNMLLPGQHIGAYRIVRQLGAGGMGAVYEVEHVELGTHYALKTFTYNSRDKYSEMLLNKFREEAKMLSRINHPCVSRAFDLTHDAERGIIYYVMDLVLYKDGESYSLDEVDRESLDEDLVYGWFCDACEALDYIHNLGIVHRDVKLENFLIDADKHAVLADFGISRIFGEEMKKEVSPYKTMRIKRNSATEKVVLGTEHYIAPEVQAGREATPAVDAYALGIMIFKLFTDRWADGMSIAQVDAYLHGYKYRWYKVVPKLVEFDPSKRPTHLVDLIPLLDRKSVPTPSLKPKPSNRSHDKSGVGIARAAIRILFAGVFCAGGYFFYRGWKQYCAQERDKAERLAAMQRQIDERTKAVDKVVTNTVERVVERAIVKVVETNVVSRVPAASVPTKELVPCVLGDGCSIEEAEYGIYENGNPVPRWCVDIKTQLGDRIKKSEYEIRVDNWLAGCDPANGRRKQAKIRYIWNGETKTVLLKEGEKFILPRDDVRRMFPKEEFVVVKDEDKADTKDYGPIPDRKYVWLKNNMAAFPQSVMFEMFNGEKIDLVPMKAGMFFMSNDNWHDKAYHKVTFTRPFWISKFLVTTAQWREFDEREVADCEKVEKLLDASHPLSKRMPCHRIDMFCDYLSKRYRMQLPKGYVFRLPTEAEWEYACNWENADKQYFGMKWEYFHPQGNVARDNLKILFGVHPELKTFFDRNDSWSGKDTSDSLYIGGLTSPSANGLYNITSELCLDIRLPKDRFIYSDDETDPLFWTDKLGKDVDVRCLVRGNWHDRWQPGYWRAKEYCHIVLGPDLIKERAWETCRRTQPAAAVKVPRQMCDFNPAKVPNKISKPKIVKMKMACGDEMEFCAVPKTKFHMSNPIGQTKTSHKVELTNPYWITRYCVTARQWREFAKYDCEGECRVVEKLFPKNPIYPSFRKPQWNAFCKYLNDNYSFLLPKGYVFRLPTEAEWEWAFVADNGLDVGKLDHRQFNPYHGANKDAFRALLQKRKVPKDLQFDNAGFTVYGSYGFRVYVGGRLAQNAFGVCDMLCPGDAIVFDEYDAHGGSNANGKWDNWINLSSSQAWKYITYENEEVNPVHWDGLRNERILGRWFDERHLHGKWDTFFTHIVIATALDVEKRVRDEELVPYAHTAFGGELLSNRIKVTDISSQSHETWHNTPYRWAMLVSDEVVIYPERKEDKDLRGFHTDKEDSPWVQLELESATVITGMQIDVFRDMRYSEHLRIWTSENGRQWREVAKDDVVRMRYRFDLRSKNVKAKFIKVGREPGFKSEYFALNKILVYGKER